MASTSDDTPQAKRLCLGTNKIEVLVKKGYSIIQIPDEMVMPLTNLIQNLSTKIANRSEPVDDVEMDEESIERLCSDAESRYVAFKEKLTKNLDKFDRESLSANVSPDEFQSFKNIRKKLTRMVKLDQSTAPYNNDKETEIVKVQVNISPLVNEKEIRSKCYNTVDSAKKRANTVASRHLANQLTMTADEAQSEFENSATDRQKLIWAKAFRAAKRGLKYEFDDKQKNRSNSQGKKSILKQVSFSSGTTNTDTNRSSSSEESDSGNQYTWVRKKRQYTHQSSDDEDRDRRPFRSSSRRRTYTHSNPKKRKKPEDHARH